MYEYIVFAELKEKYRTFRYMKMYAENIRYE